MAGHYSVLTLRLLNSAKTFVTKFQATPTANRTVSLPDRSGTVVLTDSGNSVSHSINAIAIGTSNVSNGSSSICIGHSNTSSSVNGIAIGGFGSNTIHYRVIFGSPTASLTSGASQSGVTTLNANTTDATITRLSTLGGQTPSASNQLSLPNNGAVAFNGLIVARQQASGGAKTAYWEVSGLITREGSAAATVLRYSEVRAKYNPDNLSIALSADTTNGCLAISVTGLVATNLIWVASIRSSETLYA